MDDQLIIAIDFETPPRADDLGDLFTALARDYRDMSRGRVLVVASMEHGSIIAVLKDWALLAAPHIKDAIEVAKGVKALADFAKFLKDWIDRVKSGKAKKQLYRRGRKARGQRSIEAIVKIAANSGSALRVKHTTAKGEILEVELSAPQAIKVRDEALAEQNAALEAEHLPHLGSASVELPEVQQAIGRLYAPSAVRLSSSEAQAIITTLVKVLQAAGLENLILQIAADLASRGLHELASELKARARKPDGEHEHL
jgi:hypothetical protein